MNHESYKITGHYKNSNNKILTSLKWTLNFCSRFFHRQQRTEATYSNPPPPHPPNSVLTLRTHIYTQIRKNKPKQRFIDKNQPMRVGHLAAAYREQ